MNSEQFEKFEKVAQMLRKNRGADIRARQEKRQQENIAKTANEEQTKENQKSASASRSSFSK